MLDALYGRSERAYPHKQANLGGYLFSFTLPLHPFTGRGGTAVVWLPISDFAIVSGEYSAGVFGAI